MKNYIVILLLVILAKNATAQSAAEKEEELNHHCLFEEKSWTVGLGSSYAFHVEALGINSRVYYNLGEQLCFGPEFSFFKREEEMVYDLNFVGHYIFETKLVGLYPLTGINYSIEETDNSTEKAAGFVIGAGMHRNFKTFTVFAEYSHVESDLPDDFITFGLMYTLK
ncbi:MAG: hypothetical protein ACI9DK_002337 [Vicingaceae bacterium]|jgi:hypothetical protein